MAKIRVVTDSSAQFLDPSFVIRNRVTVISNSVTVGATSYQEGVNLDSAYFAQLAHLSERGGTPMPAHRPPTSAQFEEVYGTLHRETDQVLSIHLSRGLSQVWDNAQQATRAYLGRMSILVLDSMTSSVGLGLLVQDAIQLAEQMDSAEQVARVLRKRAQQHYALFFTEAFGYLERSALLSPSHAALGEMLGIKPFVTIEDGQLSTTEKVRNRVQVVDKLVEFAAEFELSDQLYILHGGRGQTELAQQLLERLITELNRVKGVPLLPYCPTLGTFIGPDALGLMAYHPQS